MLSDSLFVLITRQLFFLVFLWFIFLINPRTPTPWCITALQPFFVTPAYIPKRWHQGCVYPWHWAEQFVSSLFRYMKIKSYGQLLVAMFCVLRSSITSHRVSQQNEVPGEVCVFHSFKTLHFFVTHTHTHILTKLHPTNLSLLFNLLLIFVLIIVCQAGTLGLPSKLYTAVVKMGRNEVLRNIVEKQCLLHL